MSKSKPKTAKCCECEKRFNVVKPLNFRCALCQVKMDQGAIEATLEECGGHLSLATLIAFYKAHKKFWDKYRSLVTAIQQAKDPVADKSNRIQIVALNELALKEEKG